MIDVNTGKNVGKQNLQETIVNTNLRRWRRSPGSCACGTSAGSSST